MDIETKDRFICWAADMDLRYDRVFLLLILKKKICRNGENPSVLSKCPEGGNCSLEGSLKELAGYRMDRAKEMLVAARENLEIDSTKHR